MKALKSGWTGIKAGALALVLAATPVLLRTPEPEPAQTQPDIDMTTTGSISPASLSPPSETPAQSFQAALNAIAAGNAQDAFAMADALPNPIERRTAKWAAIYYGGGDVDYRGVKAFAAEAPLYASASLYQTRLEQSLTQTEAGYTDIIATLGGAMPRTIDAQIALARAYVEDGQQARAQRIIRSVWADNFLDRETEDKVRLEFGAMLDRQTHWDRAVHLMMHDRAAAVERELPYLSAAQKTLAIARNAVSRNDKDAKALLDKVDPSLQSHPVYIFSRAQRARQFALWQSALDWLDKAKGELPDAAEFWDERRLLIRQALAAGESKIAYTAAAHFTKGSDTSLLEARFHAGWIALTFLKDAQAAKTQFTAMRQFATRPESITQASYWLGRALTAAKDSAGAKAAFSEAASYGTIFYGLLARAELGLPVNLRSLPSTQAREAVFAKNEIVQAVNLLNDNGKSTYAGALLGNFVTSLSEPGDYVLAARLAQKIGFHNIAITIADIAERNGVPLDVFSFPRDGIPDHVALADIDKAAVYAVARQESRFQVNAVSGVGARGLMQLMPATAKETAGKIGVEYSPNRLVTDAGYNALLGSTYLANQITRFDGSLVLAAAAYNAGAGNVAKWITANGDPRDTGVDVASWIETIPFKETRTYVQRVMANYLIYRARLGDTSRSLPDVLHRIPG